jgi:hypothetical protein
MAKANSNLLPVVERLQLKDTIERLTITAQLFLALCPEMPSRGAYWQAGVWENILDIALN